MQLEQVMFDFDSIERNTLGFKNSRTILGDITDLKDSIVADGLLNAPIVHIVGEGDDARVVLLAGYRRYQAIADRRAELSKEGNEDGWFDQILCAVHRGSLDEALALNISENLQREDLNYADKCEAVYALYERVGNQVEVSKMLSISQPQVSVLINTFRGLCREALEALRHNNIKLTQAKKLAKEFVNDDGTPDVEAQTEVLERLFAQGEAKVPDGNKDRKRAKTYRSKREVEELRTVLAGNKNEDVDADHRQSLDQFIKWYFCEVDTDEMLYRVAETADVAVPKEEKKVIKRKRRISMGQ
jgi:ParB-like chromosome segregation protein Spo0J